MKKIFISILLLFCVGFAFAAEDYSLKYNGTKYVLKYSVKNKENNGFINEYFKPEENYNKWSEMVAIHHFPNVYSPIDQTELFREFLSTLNCQSTVITDEKKGFGIIDFMIVDRTHTPFVVELNTFKFEKSPDCGTIAVQYAKRYRASNNLQVEEIRKDFDKSHNKNVNSVKKFKIPDIVNKKIGEIKLNDLQ